ncbi:MAG: heme biosynthesis protein HemY [Rhizobiales bacterium]|nr:heme biosynthesis protein HemY [Hyphomicrobiales bacterium]
MAMWRVIYIFLILVALSVLAMWLADNPGDLVMHWRGYEIRTSFVVGLGLLVVVAFLVLFAYRVTSAIITSPQGVASLLAERRRQKGFSALSRGMVAVAAGDAVEARRYAGQAHKLLDAPPLTLLLAAQAAQLEGDESAASGYFTAMLEAPETEFLGLRGLFIQARRAGDRDRALELARRAFRLRANTPWASQAVFEIESANEDWSAALQTLDKTLSAKLISREDARHRRALLLTAQAMTAEAAARNQIGDARQAAFGEALTLAQQALSLETDFAPAIALNIRLCAALTKTRRGVKLAEDAWARVPHPDIAEAFMQLIDSEAAFERLARVRQLVGRNPDHVESHVLLARAAIEARDWATARAALVPYVGAVASEQPSQRICELMADLEDGEHGDRGSARAWLARALHAPEDAMWMGENYRSKRWSPVNPVTGEFDGLVWQAPVGTLSPPGVAPVMPTSPAAEAPAEGAVPADEKAEASLETAAPATPESETVEVEEVADEPFAFFPVVPDDPGPEGAEEDAREAERGGTW